MSSAIDRLVAMESQAEALRRQISSQQAQGLPDWPRLAASLAQCERNISALQRLLDEPIPGQA